MLQEQTEEENSKITTQETESISSASKNEKEEKMIKPETEETHKVNVEENMKKDITCEANGMSF